MASGSEECGWCYGSFAGSEWGKESVLDLIGGDLIFGGSEYKIGGI